MNNNMYFVTVDLYISAVISVVMLWSVLLLRLRAEFFWDDHYVLSLTLIICAAARIIISPDLYYAYKLKLQD